MKKVFCQVCNKKENVRPSRKLTYKTCSRECLKKYKQTLLQNNCICTNCNKEFRKKDSHIRKCTSMGNFCSQKCCTSYKKDFYKGINNPNYRGKQYDGDGYRINHYPQVGRMKEHLYVTINFLKIDKIPKEMVIHHKDCNIYNNVPENLCIISKSDHRWLHSQFGNAVLWAYSQNKITLEELVLWSNDPEKAKYLLPLDLIKQSGILKLDELREKPEVVNPDLS